MAFDWQQLCIHNTVCHHISRPRVDIKPTMKSIKTLRARAPACKMRLWVTHTRMERARTQGFDALHSLFYVNPRSAYVVANSIMYTELLSVERSTSNPFDNKIKSSKLRDSKLTEKSNVKLESWRFIVVGSLDWNFKKIVWSLIESFNWKFRV